MKKNSEIKIIFTDIDWTILNHGHGKHIYDMKSIKALKKEIARILTQINATKGDK